MTFLYRNMCSSGARGIFAFAAMLVFSLPGEAQSDTLRIGIIKFKSKEAVLQTFEPLMQHVASKAGYKAVAVTLEKEKDLGFRVDKGEYDLGIFTVFPYLTAKTGFPNLSVEATHKINDEDHYKGYILTRKGIDQYNKLEGKTIFFAKETSTSGYKLPKGILREHDIDIGEDMAYQFAGGHTEALWALDSGKADAVTVDDERYRSFQGPNRASFHKLSTFEVPYHAYVFSPKMEAKRKKEFLQALFTEHKDPDSRHLFDNPLHITRFVPVNDDYYNELRRYTNELRVKSSIAVILNPSAHAIEVLHGPDVMELVKSRTQQELSNSKRFVEIKISTDTTDHKREGGTTDYLFAVDIFSAKEDTLDYHIKDMKGDAFEDGGGHGEIAAKDFHKKMPIELSGWILKGIPLRTPLLYNGKEWFITYGTDDIIKPENYMFEVIPPSGAAFPLAQKDISSASALNIYFHDHPDFQKGDSIRMTYDAEIGSPNESTKRPESSDTYNIFSRAFWQGTEFWDKVGLISGIVLAMLSAFFGKFLADRRKRRFKNILYQTHELIREYVEGHYKLESKLLEQREFIAQSLEKGDISENQFIILENRIKDLQALIEFRQKGDIKLSNRQVYEIQQIVSDGKITEREFSRIISIIKKGTGADNNSH